MSGADSDEDDALLPSGKLLKHRKVRRAESTSEVQEKVGGTAAVAIPTKAASLPWTLLGAMLLLGLAIYYYISPSAEDRETQYRLDWETGQPMHMQLVAHAAVVDGDLAAQTAIVHDALAGNDRPLVRSLLIRTAFNSAWVEDLRASDRQLALTLALSRLLGDKIPPLPNLPDAHPGVILGVVGDLNLKSSEGQFSDIATAKLAKLPHPFGLAFSALAQLNVASMGDPAARALSRIVVGNFSPETFQIYFARNDAEPVFLSKFLIVLSFTDLYPELEQGIGKVLEQRGGVFQSRVRWFDEESIAQWSSVRGRDKLFMCAAILPASNLAFEQYADLLTFPAALLRKDVLSLVQQRLSKQEGDVAAFLADGTHTLTRFQLVSLLTTLQLKGEESYPVIAKWFATKPDAESVLALLLIRTESSRIDPWNVEAARYLASHDWQATFQQYRALVAHPEPLARALAYSRLDPAVPEEASLLQDAIKIEPNEKIRNEIRRKLVGNL